MQNSPHFFARIRSFSDLWIARTDIFFAFLGVAYLALYSVQIVNNSNKKMYDFLETIGNFIWWLFIADLVIRFWGAESFIKFIKKNWIEIISVSLPFLRFLRILRVLLVFRSLKYFVIDRTRATGFYVAILVPLSWFTGAIVVLDVESRNPQANINNIGEALWWSLSTITTVGYGDLYPQTVSGKFVAATLMIVGISLFSASAAIFASWILGDKAK